MKKVEMSTFQHWTKSRDGKNQRRKKVRRPTKRNLRRKQIQVREKVGKSHGTLVFPVTCGSGGPKSRLAKAAGAEPSGQMRDKKLHADVARSKFPRQNIHNSVGLLLEVEMPKARGPLWCEAGFQVEMQEAHDSRTTFGS